MSVAATPNLTDKIIRDLKPKEKRYTLTEDSGERGESRLQINVYPSGVKKFQFQYYLNKKRKRYEFGKYGRPIGFYSLSQARAKYLELSELVKQGKEPNPSKRSMRVDTGSFHELCEAYLNFIKANRKPNTFKQYSAYYRTYIEPAFVPSDLAQDVSLDKCKSIIFPVYTERSQSSASLVKKLLSSIMQFGIDMDHSPENYGKPSAYHLTHNFVRDLKVGYQSKPRDRYLSEEEIEIVWHSNTMPQHLKHFIRLNLALAGQRIAELLHSNETEFDLKSKLVEIPVVRVKNAKRGSHVVPMGPLAIQVYNQARKNRDQNGLIFPSMTKNGGPLSVVILAIQLSSWLEKYKEVEKFTLRDIRRTCKTHMAKAEISKEDRDKLQQHFQSDVSTMNYDRYDYLREKRQAIYTWNQYLNSLLN